MKIYRLHAGTMTLLVTIRPRIFFFSLSQFSIGAADQVQNSISLITPYQLIQYNIISTRLLRKCVVVYFLFFCPSLLHSVYHFMKTNSIYSSFVLCLKIFYCWLEIMQMFCVFMQNKLYNKCCPSFLFSLGLVLFTFKLSYRWDLVHWITRHDFIGTFYFNG